MYFIASTYGKVTTVNEKSEELIERRAVTLDEKIALVRGALVWTREKINNIKQLIIINPAIDAITLPDIIRYAKSHRIDKRDTKEFQLLTTCKILNRKDLKIKESAENIVEILDSISTSLVKKIVKDERVLFTGWDLDRVLIEVLQSIKNKVGFRQAFNVGRLEDKWLYPIKDADDYLEFAKKCIYVTDDYSHSQEYLFRAFDEESFGKTKTDQPGADIEKFIKGSTSHLLIQIDDEYLTKAIAIELQDKLGKLHEFDCCDGKYEIAKNKKGLIFYNCHQLPKERLFSLYEDVQNGEYKAKPVILFSKEKINQLSEKDISKVSFPSLKDNGQAKMNVLLTLIAKNDKPNHKLAVKDPYFTLLTEFTSGQEIDRFIIENNINAEKVQMIDFWYELKEKYNPIATYIFEHVENEDGDKWRITGPGIEGLPIKYYPNKCMMYLVYLVKAYPNKVDSIELDEKVNVWHSKVAGKDKAYDTTCRSKRRKQSKLRDEKVKSNINKLMDKQEYLAKCINGVFNYYFEKSKEKKKAEKIKFLNTDGYIHIGIESYFDPQEKINIIINDKVLDSVLCEE